MVANYYNGLTHNVPVQIYKWNGKFFDEYLSLAGQGSWGLEFFQIGGTPYLAVANNSGDTSKRVNSVIYKGVLE